MSQDFAQFLHEKVSILKMDSNGLVSLNKPCFVLSQPNKSGDQKRSLFCCRYDMKRQAYVCGDSQVIYLINRLDSPVSGVLLVGLNEQVSVAAKRAFEQRKVEKQYCALVKGFLPKKHGVWRSRLDKFIGRPSQEVSRGGLYAETRYQLLNSFRYQGVMLSVVKLFPLTGRTHQLRVHCAQNRVPIVGDKVYGDRKFNSLFRATEDAERIMLHSESINLAYEMNNLCFEFRAASDSEMFYEVLERCRKKSEAMR